MKIRFDHREIPVGFISSDHKIIPLLIHALHKMRGTDQRKAVLNIDAVDYIEVIGTEAYLYSTTKSSTVYLALH
jgi:hypothetical protein